MVLESVLKSWISYKNAGSAAFLFLLVFLHVIEIILKVYYAWGRLLFMNVKFLPVLDFEDLNGLIELDVVLASLLYFDLVCVASQLTTFDLIQIAPL